MIVLHERIRRRGPMTPSLLRSVLSIEPLADMVCKELAAGGGFAGAGRKMIAVPAAWQVQCRPNGVDVVSYAHGRLNRAALAKAGKRNHWLVISNGRFITSMGNDQLDEVLQDEGRLIAVNVDPGLRAYREKICLGSGGRVVGIKRVYSNALSPAFLGDDWPHHVLVRVAMLDKLLVDDTLPLDFGDFLNACSLNALEWNCFNMGGSVLDLESEAGMLCLLAAGPHSLGRIPAASSNRHCRHIASSARLFGDVLATDTVHIGENAVIVGPAVLGENVTVGDRAIVKSSIIAPNLSIPGGSVVRDRVLTETPMGGSEPSGRRASLPKAHLRGSRFGGASKNGYRVWPVFSYARCIKRSMDILFSFIIILLFAPVFPIVAAAVKLNSPGPVFFKHRRQGLHGRPFNCLKFRTMIVRAEHMQEKLRSKNHVDGPQFKIADDPRVTTAGEFLRNTFIDEIPQFVNVLLGQMSVVGPRPSPESENLLCPFWRDARLSVRPGVTGLWQICRTRRAGQDFQEWIHYDTQYVRNMSLRQDLSICLRTARQLITNLLRQILK